MQSYHYFVKEGYYGRATPGHYSRASPAQPWAIMARFKEPQQHPTIVPSSTEPWYTNHQLNFQGECKKSLRMDSKSFSDWSLCQAQVTNHSQVPSSLVTFFSYLYLLHHSLHYFSSPLSLLLIIPPSYFYHSSFPVVSSLPIPPSASLQLSLRQLSVLPCYPSLPYYSTC